MRDREGRSDSGREVKCGWVDRIWSRRLVDSGASVEMYRADLSRPWGGGSCTASNKDRSN